jgi:AraC-like DNA-binding protein
MRVGVTRGPQRTFAAAASARRTDEREALREEQARQRRASRNPLCSGTVNDTLQRIARGLDLAERRLFDERLVPADLARAAAFSPWHFHRVFQALTGETPASYVRKRRFAEICRRLCETEMPIAALALDCGFGSQATFTRAFTREIGVSPGRYRGAGQIAPAWTFVTIASDRVATSNAYTLKIPVRSDVK